MMSSADAVCDICGKAYCFKCGEEETNLCYLCKEKVLKYCQESNVIRFSIPEGVLEEDDLI